MTPETTNPLLAVTDLFQFHVELQKKLRKRLCTGGFILHVAHDVMQDPDRGERETLFICTLILEMLHWELELVWANCCAVHCPVWRICKPSGAEALL